MNAPAAVSIRDLHVRFGETTAVEGVDLDVAPGEVFGLLGPNGAGKTTTIRVLTTLLPATSGSASVFGVDVDRHPMDVRRLLGFVPQQLSADAALTGRENVSLFARLFDVPRRARPGVVAEMLDTMGLGDSADRLVSTYSGGMIRRLELAQALVNRPRLLVLDEPTIGLDPIARSSVWERIERLREETGMTVLLTTHYMDEADALCVRFALFHRARLRALATPEGL
jgi:ABC-2 type transport system ATP-binding protein